MASQHIEQIFNNTDCPTMKKIQIKNKISAIIQKISQKIRSGLLKIPNTQRFISKPKAEIKPIKASKLTNLKKYLEDFDEKQKLSQKFTQKLMKEKIIRKHQLKVREEALKLQHDQQLEEELKAKEQEFYVKLQSKKENIEKFLIMSKERKNSLSLLREQSEKEYKRVKSVTPLFKQLESNFVSKFELPELQKRKEFLRKKHELFKPMDHETIKVHSKLVKKLKNSDSSRKLPKNLPVSQSVSVHKSKIFEKLQEEDEIRAKTELEKSISKKNLREKQKKYSELVKEIFQPSPDSLKQKEMELIKVKLENPVPKKSFLDDFKDFEIKKHAKSVITRKKKQKIVEKVPEKKEIVIKDYIQEMRMARQRSMSSKNLYYGHDSIFFNPKTPDTKKNLMRKIEVLDKVARKNEIRIGYLNVFDNKTIEATEQINSLLVNSIKAKIAILDKIY